MQTELTYSAFESRYRNKEYIGSGGFAKVYKVFDHARNHYVALKVADVRPEWNKFTLRNEVELVNKLPEHRNIARYDACYRFNTGFTGEMDFAILRFYEYGNLEQFLKKENLTEEDEKIIIQGILDGISFLHKKNVIHRDLKAQNILMHREDGVWTPKIADFGLSREILDSGTITNSSIGISYAYAAPEQIQNKKIYRNVDLWAAGVIIYRIIMGELPFKGMSEGDNKSAQSQLELSKKIVNLEVPEALEKMAEPYRSIVKRCLVLDPTKRAQEAEELIGILQGVKTEGPAEEKVAKKKSVEARADFQAIAKEILPKDSKAMDVPMVTPPPTFTSPSSYNSPAHDYNIPKDNVTQILGPKSTVDNAPETPMTREFRPAMGEPKSSGRWLWLLIPLLLIGIGGGLWWTNFRTAETRPFSQTTVMQVPAKSSQKLNAQKVEALVRMDKKIVRAKETEKGLEKLDRELAVLKKDEAIEEDYRIHLLEAKLRSIQNDQRKVLQALTKSAEQAIKKEATKDLLQELEVAEKVFFDKFSKINNGKHWDNVVQAIKIGNN